MTIDALKSFEPELAKALLAMMDARLGPAFDLADALEVIGNDPTLIHGPFASDRIASAKLATVAAMQKMSPHLESKEPTLGIVAHVIVGPQTPAIASVQTVVAVLHSDVAHDVTLICGASIDPAMGTHVQVVLWDK